MSDLDQANPLKQAELAWITLVTGVLIFDLVALNTNKVETLSSAVWRSLSKPHFWPIYMGTWIGLTYHLFLSPSARKSYKQIEVHPTFTKKGNK